MISLECTGRLAEVGEGTFLRKNWGKILVAELIIAALGLTLLIIGWLSLSNPSMVSKGVMMIYVGGAASALIFLTEMVTLAVHYASCFQRRDSQ